MDRFETLKNLVSQNPGDTFARYGLAMEHTRRGEHSEAVEQYQAIAAANPDYAAVYFQGGQALERIGRKEEAKQFYLRGIEVTTKLGDGHARDQLQAALDMLG